MVFRRHTDMVLTEACRLTVKSVLPVTSSVSLLAGVRDTIVNSAWLAGRGAAGPGRKHVIVSFRMLMTRRHSCLKVSEPTSTIEKTADDFVEFFHTKINNIRRSTADAPPPVIVDRPCTRPSEFTEVTADEVSHIVMQAPAKHCTLDPAPTWLVKRLFANKLANICNSTCQESLFLLTF